VRIITLPAYSLELNPAEKLWDHFKDAICNEVFATVEKLRERLAGWLKEFWSDGARALSLTGRGWLLDSVNAGAKSGWHILNRELVAEPIAPALRKSFRFPGRGNEDSSAPGMPHVGRNRNIDDINPRLPGTMRFYPRR